MIKVRTSSDPQIGNNFRRDTVKTLEFILDEPVRVTDYAFSQQPDIKDEAPSFKMEAKCPTLLALSKILYSAK